MAAIQRPSAEPLSFRHAGDAGDIIYALPVMRWLGGGSLFLEDSDYTRLGMTQERVTDFSRLLTTQRYVHNVELYRGQEVAVDLNAFRLRMKENHRRETLVEMQCHSHGCPLRELEKPWLKADPHPIPGRPVIINCTRRYRNMEFPWTRAVQKYDGQIGFVGSPDEYEHFIESQDGHRFDNPRYIETPTMLSLAKVIAGSKLFIGNQSLPLALAHAMHHPTICEHSRTGIDGWHRKKNCFGTAGSQIHFPKLWALKLHFADTLRHHSALATALTWARAAIQ